MLTGDALCWMGALGTLWVLTLERCPTRVSRALRVRSGCPRGCNVAREFPAVMDVGCHPGEAVPWGRGECGGQGCLSSVPLSRLHVAEQ